MKITINDKIVMLIGKDKNRQGQVIKVLPKLKKIYVKGINLSKKHLKSSQDKPGGIIEKEMPIFISKVALICPACTKPTRVGYKIDEKGKKMRICRKCLAPIDQKTFIKKVSKKTKK